MTPTDMIRWREILGFSRKEAAEALGLNVRTIQYFEKGKTFISRTVALACAAIYHRHEPWPFDRQH